MPNGLLKLFLVYAALLFLMCLSLSARGADCRDAFKGLSALVEAHAPHADAIVELRRRADAELESLREEKRRLVMTKDSGIVEEGSDSGWSRAVYANIIRQAEIRETLKARIATIVDGTEDEHFFQFKVRGKGERELMPVSSRRGQAALAACLMPAG